MRITYEKYAIEQNINYRNKEYKNKVEIFCNIMIIYKCYK